jgi:precorrin-2 dehydrogenase / sirohydrochlorin ferrochelatase
MVPIVLDPKNVKMAVIGQGDAMARRVAQLQGGGAENVVLIDMATDDLPTASDLKGIGVVFVAGLDTTAAAEITAIAKNVGALVNVEDMTDHCDFHMPAVVRRGDLLLTASTGGKSPGLARELRVSLESQFGDEWAQIVDEVADARRGWLAEGTSMKAVAERTEQLINKNGWLA